MFVLLRVKSSRTVCFRVKYVRPFLRKWELHDGNIRRGVLCLRVRRVAETVFGSLHLAYETTEQGSEYLVVPDPVARTGQRP